MKDTTADFLLQRLVEWGITRIYGYPGDGINGIVGAFERLDDAIDFIQVRHEEMAAFMACAHAKFTGNVGVCLATSGPGAIHLLNGLYDAKKDHQPVVAIVGHTATSALGGDYQQEVDLPTLFKDVASEYLVTVSNPVAMRHAVDRAVRIARALRTVTCIIIPNDVQLTPAVKEPPHAHNTLHSGLGYSAPRIIPTVVDLQQAASVLNEGKRVAILAGAGASHAADELLAVADLLGAGVAKALLGKAVVGDDLPFVTGCIGLLGTRPSSDMMAGCDTLLLVGTTFPYAEFLPKAGQARGVQIDIDPRSLSMRYPTEVNLVGDSAPTLRELIPLLDRKDDRTWRAEIEQNVARWWRLVEAHAHDDAGETGELNPQRVFWELSEQLPDGSILTGDAGTATNWFARTIRVRAGMKTSLSGGLATMGSAVPYAIAAKFAYPDRVAIALTGDGAMQMNGTAELLTIAKYWHRWSDPRLIIVVLNNRDLAQVTWEMRVMAGNPKYEASQSLPDFGYAAYADAIGLQGIRVDRPEDVKGAWARALAADRPVVFEAYTDANVPMLPPHISFDEARSLMSALVKGDPSQFDVIKESLRSVVTELAPHGAGR